MYALDSTDVKFASESMPNFAVNVLLEIQARSNYERVDRNWFRRRRENTNRHDHSGLSHYETEAIKVSRTGVTPRFARLISEPPWAVFDIKLHQVSLLHEEFWFNKTLCASFWKHLMQSQFILMHENLADKIYNERLQ